MPLVTVTHKAGKLTSGQRSRLALTLQISVAQALTVDCRKEAHLVRQDIEVRFKEFGPDDICPHDVAIFIVANHYPEREKNLSARRDSIVTDVSYFFHAQKMTVKGSVWVLLQPGSFTEF